VSIGINLPVYPRLVRVPDYPVYAPQVDTNYFSTMACTGSTRATTAAGLVQRTWGLVAPDAVPLFIPHPRRYYRRPPTTSMAGARRAPHWDEHWGSDWRQRQPG
jgi:hypothetical protein